MLRTPAFLLVALLAMLPGYAQESPAPRAYSATRLSAPVRIDGKLDDLAWQGLAPIRDFTQTAPDQGKPISERTEAFVAYDEHAIYFAVRCWDSDPGGIIARYGAHDASTKSDSIDIFIDTFGDRRTGYLFSIGARGNQFDAIADESRGTGWGMADSSWDGIWQTATSIEDWGWSLEVAIPFKSIRLSRDQVQSWGLNIGREIVRKNERAYWSAVTRFEGTMRPATAGTLSGLEDLRVGRNLEVIPFVTTKYRRSNWRPELDRLGGNTGLDARYALSANLTASFTVNPDFGETEADEFTSAISRFEIFFPEKRKFFTEGATYFDTPLDLFFSRRIGERLPNGEPQRVIQGGKITGKIGAWTIGALEAVTQEATYIDPDDDQLKLAPRAGFIALRLRRDVFSNSSLGFTSVARFQGTGDFGQQQSGHGIDFTYKHGQHVSWTSQAIVSTNRSNPGLNWQHVGLESSFRYNSDDWEWGGWSRFLGREVDLSSIGYEPVTDRWVGQADVAWKPFVNRWGVRQLFVLLNHDQYNNTRGEIEDSGSDAQVTAQFQNFWEATVRYSYDRTRYNNFTADFRALETTRIYLVPRMQFIVETNDNRPFWFQARYTPRKMVQYDENFYGSAREGQLHATARVGSHLRLQASGVFVREFTPDGQRFQDRRYLITRANYQFTSKLRARLLTQIAETRYGRNVGLNSLVAYDFTARSALYAGYTRQRQLPLAKTDLGHELFIKLSYLFAF